MNDYATNSKMPTYYNTASSSYWPAIRKENGVIALKAPDNSQKEFKVEQSSQSYSKKTGNGHALVYNTYNQNSIIIYWEDVQFFKELENFTDKLKDVLKQLGQPNAIMTSQGPATLDPQLTQKLQAAISALESLKKKIN